MEEKAAPDGAPLPGTRAARRAQARPARRRLLPALLVANITAVAAAGAFAWTAALPDATGVATVEDSSAGGDPGTSDPAAPAAVRPVDELCIAHAGDTLDLGSLEGRALVSAAGGSDLDAWCRDVTGRG